MTQTILMLVILGGAAAVQAAPVPSPITLLQRTVDAHKKLGPASVTVKLEEMKAGKPVSEKIQTVDRNDPQHYVARFTEGDVQIHLIANGDNLVQHVVSRNVYRKRKNYGMDLMMPFSRLRSDLAKGLGKPDVKTRLASAKVSSVIINKEPCYRLDWMPPTSLNGLPVKAIVVSKRDGLMRQAVLHEEGKATLRATIAYQRRDTPFPAGTFAFVPPPGAKDLDAEPPTPPAPEPDTEAGS